MQTVFATKMGMSQAWTKQGKRLAVTRCRVEPNLVVGQQIVTPNFPQSQNFTQDKPLTVIEIGYGHKKLKNMTKPLRTRLEKGGFSFGVKQIRGVRMADTVDQTSAQNSDGGENAKASSLPKIGETITLDSVLHVGDKVMVRGTTKGRGFAGAVKRYGFKGGPKTHGQSDRQRAVGSIGAGTTPGRVYKGKRMPGHYGVESKTIKGLIVLHIDPETQEVWLSGPVPGSLFSTLEITATGKTKAVELNAEASGIVVKVAETPVVEEQSIEKQPAETQFIGEKIE